MKNVLIIFSLLFGLATQAQDNTAFKKETVEFIKISGAGDAFESAITQFGKMVSPENKGIYTTEANATLSGLYNKMAELYMQDFTNNEIKELAKFYKTPLGKKLANKQLGLTQNMMGIGQSWAIEVQEIAQKYSK